MPNTKLTHPTLFMPSAPTKYPNRYGGYLADGSSRALDYRRKVQLDRVHVYHPPSCWPVTDFTKSLVWTKADPIDGEDPAFIRECADGEIHWLDFGNRNSPFGWEFKRIVSREDDGTELLDNVRPARAR